MTSAPRPSPQHSHDAPLISNFKPLAKGCALGVFDVEISGLKVFGCMLLESGGRRWFNWPAQKQFDQAGKPILDEKGRPRYLRVIEFASRASSDRIQKLVLDVLAAEGYLAPAAPTSDGECPW